MVTVAAAALKFVLDVTGIAVQIGKVCAKAGDIKQVGTAMISSGKPMHGCVGATADDVRRDHLSHAAIICMAE